MGAFYRSHLTSKTFILIRKFCRIDKIIYICNAEIPFTVQDTSRGLVVVLRRLKVCGRVTKEEDLKIVIAMR